MARNHCKIYAVLIVIFTTSNGQKEETEQVKNNRTRASEWFVSSNSFLPDNKTEGNTRYETQESFKSYPVLVTATTGIRETTTRNRTIINKSLEHYTTTKPTQAFQHLSEEEMKKNYSIHFGFIEKERKDGFKTTKPEENPYSVILVISTSLDINSICSGTLLTLQWVLTAAHCLKVEIDELKFQALDCRTSDVIIYAGGNSVAELQVGDLAVGSQNSSCSTAYPHPEFVHGMTKIKYDLALVLLKEPFNWSTTVQPVKLSITPWTFTGYRTCKLTAFGVVQKGERNPEDNERKTHMFEVEKPCQCYQRADFASCAKVGLDFGVCTGDSGGGLICDGEVLGVVAGAITMDYVNRCKPIQFGKCGSENTVSIFTLVYPYLDWIYQHVPDEHGLRVAGTRLKSGGGSVVDNTVTLFGFKLFYVSVCVLCLFIN